MRKKGDARQMEDLLRNAKTTIGCLFKGVKEVVIMKERSVSLFVLLIQ